MSINFVVTKLIRQRHLLRFMQDEMEEDRRRVSEHHPNSSFIIRKNSPHQSPKAKSILFEYITGRQSVPFYCSLCTYVCTCSSLFVSKSLLPFAYIMPTIILSFRTFWEFISVSVKRSTSIQGVSKATYGT